MSLAELIRLDGKRALVTGGGNGIGKGCALELAGAGADIILNDRPGRLDATDVAEAIRGLGRQCWIVEADVFSREGCESLVESAIEAAGGIDILVSNPAYGKRCDFIEFPPDEFDRVIDATFKSGFHLSRTVARHMIEANIPGSILFISSVQAEMPFARSAPYGAAKAALNHLTQSIAVEMFPHRINVNAIEPGWIDTPNERKEFSEETLAAEGAKLPWGRLGLPSDIGRAAAFLASEAADYITGTILPVDGGFRFKDLQADAVKDIRD
ncbi:SDR family oxidoreductase [Verrucomicrobiales bacterium]|jgi:glucose 1-dehydrogenase|nr:SDR family oxidoreductase [Verrucomicrobiales bacterium]